MEPHAAGATPAGPGRTVTTDDLCRLAAELKEVRRAGWLRVGNSAPESVADHSYGVALLALLRCPPELDRGRLLIMAILHDLAEVRVGDITPHDGVPAEEKHRREDEVMAALLVDRPELLALWREAEAQQTPEARFLKEMDRLDMRLQAERYAATGRISAVDAGEFMRSSTRED